MDKLLDKAKVLYQDRVKIAFSAILITGTIAFYLFYSSGIQVLEPPPWFPRGSIQGLEVVASYNTIGFILAVGLMILLYGFWQWAFLPSPAAIYTRGVLRGILGRNVEINQKIGRRFRVLLEDGKHIDIECRIKEPSGNWFLFRLSSSRLSGEGLDGLALRHGMSLKDNRFVSSVYNDEFHHRILLLAKAMSFVQSS